MNRQQGLAVLYEMAIVTGGELQLEPLLIKALERLLFHASFPCGMVFLDPVEGEAGSAAARLELSLGDFELARHNGAKLRVPLELLRGDLGLYERPDLISALPCKKDFYRFFLRLPIDGAGVIVLLSPERPAVGPPPANILKPALRNLSKSIELCRSSEAYTQGIITDRGMAVEALQELSYRNRLILDSVGEGICGVDRQGHATFANPAATRMLGFGPGELVGRPLHELVGRRTAAGAEAAPDQSPILQTIRDGRRRRVDDGLFTRKDGVAFPVRYVCTPLHDGDLAMGAVIVFEDITERRKAENDLKKLNRALQTLSTCNMTLIHVTEESKLLHDICRVLAEVGGYSLVWVGYAEQDGNKFIRPVAHAGREEGYLDAVPLTWGGGCTCPACESIKSGEPFITQNIGGLVDPAPWRVEALKRGYAACLAVPLRSDGRVIGTLNIYAGEADAFTEEEMRLLNELAGDLSFGLVSLRTRTERDKALQERQSYLEKLRKVLVDTVQSIAAIVEIRDPYLSGHQRRVAQLAVAISRELGLGEEQIEGLRFGSLIHDIGKIYVPAEFLSRPGRLMDLEFSLIKTHAEMGYSIVKDIEFPWPVAQMIRQHHEYMDGTGYPRGLQGDEIIIEARILAVADAVEAMASHRPYRPARGVGVALEEINHDRGKRYDANVVDACIKLFWHKRFKFS